MLLHTHGKILIIMAPPSLISNTLKHAEECQALITLIIFHWPSAPWWPLLYFEGKWMFFIKDFFYVQKSGGFSLNLSIVGKN